MDNQNYKAKPWLASQYLDLDLVKSSMQYGLDLDFTSQKPRNSFVCICAYVCVSHVFNVLCPALIIP